MGRTPFGQLKIWRQLRHIAGPVRTERNNRALATGLAFTAGMVNSVGFVAIAIYTSHMTGLTAMLADQLVFGDYWLALLAGLAIVSFVCGAICCSVVFNFARRRRLRSRYAVVLVLEALATLLVGLLAEEFADREIVWPIIAVLGWTMGLQNAMITKITNAQIRTTHVTGMVTDIGIELGKAIYLKRSDDPDPVVADYKKLGLHTQIVLVFFAGGLIGALLSTIIGFYTVMPAAAILLVLALIPVLEDLNIYKHDHHAYDLIDHGTLRRDRPRGSERRGSKSLERHGRRRRRQARES